MDRCQLNLAGRVLDPLGLLCNLCALAITADDEQCEIPPAVVIDMVKRAISLVGNALFCATSDRRKGLLVKLHGARMSRPSRRHGAVYARSCRLVWQKVQEEPSEGVGIKR